MNLNRATKLFLMFVLAATVMASTAAAVTGFNLTATSLLNTTNSGASTSVAGAYYASVLNYNWTMYYNISIFWSGGGGDNVTNITLGVNDSRVNITGTPYIQGHAQYVCTINNRQWVNCANTSIVQPGNQIAGATINDLNGSEYYFVFNFSSSADAVLNWTVNLSSDKPVAATVTTNQTAWPSVDSTPPTFTIVVNNTAFPSRQSYNLTSSTASAINVTYSSNVANFSSINTSMWYLGTKFWENFTSVSVPGSGAANGFGSDNKSHVNNTVLSNLTFSGVYTINVWAQDAAGNVNNSATIANFTVFNGLPYPNVTANSQINITTSTTLDATHVWSFQQKFANYSLPVPWFVSDQNSSLATGFVVPQAYDNESIITSSTLDSLVYNFTFTYNSSSSANYSVNFTVFAALPANATTFTAVTPAGNKTVYMNGPACPNRACGGGNAVTDFTIYYNGTAYQANRTLSSTQPVNGTHVPGQINSVLLSFFNGTLNNTGANGVAMPVNVSILFSPIPPINISQQLVTGFMFNNGSGTGINTSQRSLDMSYYINVSGLSDYFVAGNTTMDFIFPANVSIAENVTSLSSNILLRRLNGTDPTNANHWILVANSSNATGANPFHNASLITFYTFSTSMIPQMNDSPFNNTWVNITFWGFKYRLNTNDTDSNMSTKFTNQKNLVLNATSTVVFNISRYTVRTVGTTRTSTITLDAGTKGGIFIPTDTNMLPDWTTSAKGMNVRLNGQPLPENTSWTRGSITISGAQASQGTNTITVSYTIAAAASNDGQSSGGGGGSTTTDTSSQRFLFDTFAANTERTVTFSNAVGVDKILITPNAALSNVVLEAKNLGTSKPSSITVEPRGTLVRYVQITPTGLTESSLTTVKIQFSVLKSWLANNSMNENDVVLQRYKDGAWTVLRTTKLASGTDKVTYEATTPGFSYFAITGEELAGACPKTQADCQAEFTLDTVLCACVCAKTAGAAPPGYVLDTATCTYKLAAACTKTQADCAAGETLNTTSCACEKPAVAGEVKKPAPDDNTPIFVVIAIAIVAVLALLWWRQQQPRYPIMGKKRGFFF